MNSYTVAESGSPTQIRRLRMCGLAQRYDDVSDEILEAAFAAAISAPDPDLDRVEAVRAKLRSGRPDAWSVAESMLIQAVAFRSR